MRSILFIIVLTLICAAASAQTAKTKPAQEKYPVLDVRLIDSSVDPCQDFYQYACGNWVKSNEIPPDRDSWSVFAQVADRAELVLRDILEKATVERPQRSAVDQKIGDYYSACMDEKTINQLGAKPLAVELKRIGEIKSKDELPAEIAHLHRIGAGPLFAVDSEQDAKDSTQYIAGVNQGGLGLPDRDYYLKDDEKFPEQRKQYLAHVQKMFVLSGERPSQAADDAKTVMQIETALAKASLTRVDLRDPQKVYHKMTVEQLAALSPSFHWSEYFNSIGIPKTQSLNVAEPDFFQQMEGTLNSISLPQWKAYLRWHLVHNMASLLASNFEQADFDFYGRTLRGTEQLEPRWKRCVHHVDDQLGEALGQAYVQRAFGPELKQRTVTMVKEIEEAMEQDIHELTWMSDATKQQALEKLHGVANKIGYPDKWRDYSKLDIVHGDFVGNVNRADEFEFQRELAKIGAPLDRGEWQMTPPTVNAYYDPQMNDINFPAGILQPPLYDPESDDAPNYGDTGSTIGHELTHGFDDQGRQFDAKGNLRDWWTEDDGKEFEHRASCISDQYSQYVIIDDIKINGKLTLGEDVADLGGTILAWVAWRHSLSGKSNEKNDPPNIDGFSPEQRFFIGNAQQWCSKRRPELMRLRAVTDPHSPPKYRTNGVVSNMPEFQQAFSCKKDSPMVREKPCRVW